MGSLTKASGVAVSMLVAATASVLLLLPGHPRMRTSRGAGMTPAVMVASATATPPGPSPVLSGAAHRCLPPVALTQHCRVSGDSTGGTRAATAGRRRCRHGPAGTGLPDPGPAAHRPERRPGRHRPGRHRPGRHRPGRHQPERHRPGRHQPERHRPGRHQPERHRPGRHQPERHRSGHYWSGHHWSGRHRPGEWWPGQLVARGATGSSAAASQPAAKLPDHNSAATAVIGRNWPAVQRWSLTVSACATGTLWPRSSQATGRVCRPPMTATRRICSLTVRYCSPSRPTRLTPCRTRSSSPPRRSARCAIRTGSGPGCTQWPGTNATGSCGPGIRPPRWTSRPR